MSKEKPHPEVRIIIKKKGGHEGGYHGGAWKVAYADFVTAMMALFIVLWIVAQSQEVKESVAGYFKDPGAFDKAQSSLLPGGNGLLEALAASTKDKKKEEPKTEREKLEEERKKIQEMIASSPSMSKLLKQVQVTVSKEGLRIDLMENATGLFFGLGSAGLTPEAQELLKMLGAEIGSLPNHVTVEGYTDARPYTSRHGYSNWELSADRANAARKVLEESGLRKYQVAEVRGYGDRKLKNPKNPYDPTNRRVSILVKSLEK